MTESKEAKAEIKCCDANRNMKFCGECGKKIAIQKEPAIPEYRRQLDKVFEYSDIVICGDTFKSEGEIQILGCRKWWDSFLYNRQVPYDKKISILDGVGAKYVIIGSAADIKQANKICMHQGTCCPAPFSIEQYICGMTDTNISNPINGRSLCFRSNCNKMWNIETPTQVPQLVTTKYSTKCKHETDHGWDRCSNVKLCSHVDEGKFFAALDEIKTVLCYSPAENKLYSAEDLLAIIGKTLDYLNKDLASITRIHRIRKLEIRVITDKFKHLPELCMLSNKMREVAGACEGISVRGLHSYLFT